MKRTYSKPSGDVRRESEQLSLQNDEILEERTKTAAGLLQCKERRACLLCHKPLADSVAFDHRGHQYRVCGTCHHVQSKAQPDEGYPFKNGATFSRVYPKLEQAEYASRRDRIYRPKLDWIMQNSRELGYSPEELLALRWLELGAGAGYFLSSLQQAGARQFQGLERDPQLAEAANSALRESRVLRYSGSLRQAVREHRADVYVAFFVLEHIDDSGAFFTSLRDLPKGTVFYFSVPTFGFAAWLESAFDVHVARCLDSVFHTQLYTDQSIEYAARLAEMEIVAEWIFGQDGTDFGRLLDVALRGKYPDVLREEVTKRYGEIQDGFQAVLDRALLADSRHFLAVRR